MRRLRWVAAVGASEAEPRALHGAERLVVVRARRRAARRSGPRLDVFPRLCEIKILRAASRSNFERGGSTHRLTRSRWVVEPTPRGAAIFEPRRA